jgi:hypothetical protein
MVTEISSDVSSEELEWTAGSHFILKTLVSASRKNNIGFGNDGIDNFF